MMRMTAMMVQSDLPLFDDVKKRESYLMRETPYFVLLIFCTISVGHLLFWTCIYFCVDMYLFMLVMFCEHVFHLYFMT